MNLEEHKVDLPEGESGDWAVSKYVISEQEQRFQELRAMFNPHRPARIVPAGEYTRLTRNGTIIMSDTPNEIEDHLEAILNTHDGGHALVGGLGLGLVAEAMLKRGAKVTVIELSKEVIELVGSVMKERYGDQIEIINADVMEWKPPKGQTYDVVWMDIWDNINQDNLPQMATLNRRYARKAKWKGCWQQEGCQGQRYRVKNKIGWY